MKRNKERSAAIVTIFRAGDMTPKGRKAIAAWLHQQAGFLQDHAKQLAPRYTARYLY